MLFYSVASKPHGFSKCRREILHHKWLNNANKKTLSSYIRLKDVLCKSDKIVTTRIQNQYFIR